MLAIPELREEIQQQFPREIFFIEQSHSAYIFFAGYDLRLSIDPITKHFAAHIAWRDLHARIVANAFDFSGNADRIHIQLGIVRIET